VGFGKVGGTYNLLVGGVEDRNGEEGTGVVGARRFGFEVGWSNGDDHPADEVLVSVVPGNQSFISQLLLPCRLGYGSLFSIYESQFGAVCLKMNRFESGISTAGSFGAGEGEC
jgi:hypothetical protein